MFSTASINKLITAATVLSVASLIVLVPVAARGETALRPRGDEARVGNWAGAPRVRPNNLNRLVTQVGRIKIIERAGDQQSCRNTVFVPAHPRRCPGELASPEIAYGEDIDQALNASVQETAVRNPKSGVKIQPPTDEKVLPLKSTAHLNVEEPEPVKPKLSVNPELAQPKGPQKDQPQLPSLLSCDKAGAIVGDFGFSAIKPSDCDGQVFAFDASRDGKPFKITLNSASGELIQVRKIPLGLFPSARSTAAIAH